MKKVFLCVLIASIYLGLAAQTTIALEDVGKHVGDSVTVCGKVERARYLEQSKDSTTFLNLGAAFPNQLLTIVIWKNVRSEFETPPEDLQGKSVCVTGKITLYKDKPQIVLAGKKLLVLQP